MKALKINYVQLFALGLYDNNYLFS